MSTNLRNRYAQSHDLKNALRCVKRVADLIPSLASLRIEALTQVQQELAQAAHVLETGIRAFEQNKGQRKPQKASHENSAP